MQVMILKSKCPHHILNKPHPSQRMRLKIWQLVTSNLFDSIVIVTIVLNMI